MTGKLSNAQIDKLGERLKSDPVSDDDLKTLDEFRRTFTDALDAVVRKLHELGFEPTGRSKTNDSIIAKIGRGELRSLSRMQDIAGCRIIESSIIDQDWALARLSNVFRADKIVDRRLKPRNGYRAIHLIPRVEGQAVEIQIRTKLQHLWAELSEAYSITDPSIKYGGGHDDIREMLSKASTTIANCEAVNLPEFVALRNELATGFESAIVRVRHENSTGRRTVE